MEKEPVQLRYRKKSQLPAEAPQPILIKKKITHEEMPSINSSPIQVCARREAARCKRWKVTVNGQLIKEPDIKSPIMIP